MKEIPDSILAAYVAAAVKMHGSAGADIEDTVDHPDSGEMLGKTATGDAWRLADGWGEWYFCDPPKGDAIYVCSKMPDVMAVDIAPKYKSMIKYKELGMGDTAWDAAVLAALGEKK